jgi:FkbM family methyltransferase
MAMKAYENYPKLIWENVAISDTEEQKKLFYVKNVPEDKYWMLGVASFDLDRVMKVTGFPETEISMHDVECLPLSEVIKKHCFYDVDLMVIDVEGHELNVIKSIDFNLFSVKVVIIETHMKRDVFEAILTIFPETYRGIFAENTIDSVIYRTN